MNKYIVFAISFARHGGKSLIPLNNNKTSPLPKNFSLLSFTNLAPFESTYLANHSDVNFFRIHCILPKILYSITVRACHGGAPLKHLSTTRKLLPLEENFSLLSFINLILFESTYLSDYHDINFFRIHCVLQKISHSLTPFGCNGGGSSQHLSTTRKLLSLKKLSFLSTTKLISLEITCLSDYNDVNLV